MGSTTKTHAPIGDLLAVEGIFLATTITVFLQALLLLYMVKRIMLRGLIDLQHLCHVLVEAEFTMNLRRTCKRGFCAGAGTLPGTTNLDIAALITAMSFL